MRIASEAEIRADETPDGSPTVYPREQVFERIEASRTVTLAQLRQTRYRADLLLEILAELFQVLLTKADYREMIAPVVELRMSATVPTR